MFKNQLQGYTDFERKYLRLKSDIETEMTNLLNSFVEGTSFNEEDIIEIIKEVALEMRY